MKLNKQEQNGLLLVLYLSRAGKAKLEDVAANLSISLHFLEQIARKLRVGGILTSTRGPGGGYSIAGTPTVYQVLKALGTQFGLSVKDATALRQSTTTEGRALANLALKISLAVGNSLQVKVGSVCSELVEKEMRQLGVSIDGSPVEMSASSGSKHVLSN